MGGTLILPSFEREFGLDNKSQKQLDDLTSNIVSCFQAGMFFGALSSYFVSDRWGRKWCMTLAIIVFSVGASMQTGSQGIVALIMAGRALAGLGIGAAAPVIPVYALVLLHFIPKILMCGRNLRCMQIHCRDLTARYSW